MSWRDFRSETHKEVVSDYRQGSRDLEDKVAAGSHIAIHQGMKRSIEKVSSVESDKDAMRADAEVRGKRFGRGKNYQC